MSRSLSFGYNAVAALAEMVAERLVQAPFADGTISEFISTTDLGSELTGSLNLLISKPQLDLVVLMNPDRVRLSIDIHAVLKLTQGGMLDIADGDWFKACLTLMPKIQINGGKLSPVWSSLSGNFVKFTNVSSNKASIQLLAPTLLSQRLNTILSSGDFDKLSVQVGLDANGIQSDDFDVVVVDVPPPTDRDELVFAAYDSKNVAQTRGSTGQIQSCIDSSRSIAVRLSKATFDSLIKDMLDTMYMRFDVKLGEPEPWMPMGGTPVYDPGPDQLKRKIGWGKAVPGLPGSLSSAACGLAVLPEKSRANLRNCTVTNLRTNEKSTFSTGQGGAGKYSVLSDSIPFNDLKEGDTLRFYGEYRYEQSTDIYYPSLTLQDGYVEMAVKAVRDVLCYHDVEIDLVSKVTLSIDPATGDLQVKAGEPDIDMPWYVEAGVLLAEIALSVLTGPMAGMIIGDMTSVITDSVESEVGKTGGGLMPKLASNPYMRLFWESLTVQADGLIFQGQVEAGWLNSGGLARGLEVPLDWEGNESCRFKVFTDTGKAVLMKISESSLYDPESSLALANMSATFESLGPEQIKTLTGGTTAQSITVPTGNVLAGTVFVVNTGWGRYAKVRVDKSVDNQYVLRWITYNHPKPPSMSIRGSWKNDMQTVKKGWVNFHVVRHYWGDFYLDFNRVYTKEGLKIKWSYQGPGTFKVVSADQHKVQVAVNVEGAQITSFQAVLKVEVDDLFGRKFTDQWNLSGSSGWGEKGEFAEQRLSLEELILQMHGPGPVSQPIDRLGMIAKLEDAIVRYQQTLTMLQNMK